MVRIDDVDLQDALYKIARTNTFYHLDNDINVSFDQMKTAHRLLVNDPLEKILIWVSYPSGIDCYSERDVFQKDTRGYNGVIYHGNGADNERKLAYAVEVTEYKEEKGEIKLYGNLFEINIKEYAHNVKNDALTSNNKSVFYVDSFLGTDIQTTMTKEEFDNDYPHEKLKTAFHWRNEPDNLYILKYFLIEAQEKREFKCEASDLWLHESNLYDGKIKYYADEIMRKLNEISEPNSPDKQFFTADVNYIVANNFDTERIKQLLDAIPYKNVEYGIKKGQYGFKINIPRDEILQERQGGEIFVNENITVYPYAADVARQNGETPLYRESLKTNKACAEMIDNVIQKSRYRDEGYNITKAVNAVIAEFGIERMNWVLANTLQNNDYDGRFSRGNKEWAKGFAIPKDYLSYSYEPKSHPEHLNNFITKAREICEEINNMQEQKKGKPSVLGQVKENIEAIKAQTTENTDKIKNKNKLEVE